MTVLEERKKKCSLSAMTTQVFCISSHKAAFVVGSELFQFLRISFFIVAHTFLIAFKYYMENTGATLSTQYPVSQQKKKVFLVGIEPPLRSNMENLGATL